MRLVSREWKMNRLFFPIMSQKTLSETFLQYFRVAYADSPELQTLAYRIRYQVYCEEFGFENSTEYKDQCERDEMDAIADQALLIHLPTGEAIGCSRLIGSRGCPPSGCFPFEQHCSEGLDAQQFDLKKIPKTVIGEFSRLAVLAKFRRRKNDERRPISLPDSEVEADDHEQRSSYPLIPLGLFVCSLSMLVLSSLDYGVAMMEPRLARKLRWHGIRFTQIGPVIDFRGKRAPYYISRSTVLEDLNKEIALLRNDLTQQLLESRTHVVQAAAREDCIRMC